jgi:hypothetical protein
LPISEQVLFRFPNLPVYKPLGIEHYAERGWEDLHYGCRTVGGPTLSVDSRDLSAKPLVIPFDLTKRFQFKSPGVYTIRFSTDIGLEDDSNATVQVPHPPIERSLRHSVNASGELQMEIVSVSGR